MLTTGSMHMENHVCRELNLQTIYHAMTSCLERTNLIDVKKILITKWCLRSYHGTRLRDLALPLL